MAGDGIEGLEAMDADEDGLVDLDGDGVEDLDIEELEEALEDGEIDADELEELGVEEGEVESPLAEDPVTDDDEGEVLRTIDTTGDGYADVVIHDRDGDGEGDFVTGDLDNDGYEDLRLVDTDGDGTSDITAGGENYGFVSDSAEESIATMDLDTSDLDSDRDGISNIDEHDAGLNPVDSDTISGWGDADAGAEVGVAGDDAADDGGYDAGDDDGGSEY